MSGSGQGEEGLVDRIMKGGQDKEMDRFKKGIGIGRIKKDGREGLNSIWVG